MERQTKRSRRSSSGAYHDLVPLEEEGDFELVHSREGRLSHSGRTRATVYSEAELVSDGWSQVTVWSPPDDPMYALDPDGNLFERALEQDVLEDIPSIPAKKSYTKSKVSKRPHVVWMENHRELYLDEMLRWAGRGDFLSQSDCMDCIARKAEVPGLAEYRCRECFQVDLTCQSCCVKRHRMNPLHVVEKWSDGCFTKTSLKSLGLKLQLNHSSMYCSNPVQCHQDLRILHINGIHDVSILYCGCDRAIPQHIQLLRRRIYPASQLSVQTAASFELLRVIHMLMLSTKSSIYDFYGGLDKLTDNTSMRPIKSRYRGLYRMSLQWRHLKMLKRGGRGHHPSGLTGIEVGELAIQCPSCPRPGVNLPDDWENTPPGMKFLYLTVLCMDANFRLKNNLVSNYSQDPGLGIGWSYMLPRIPYERYVLSRADDADISTCVGFQALSKANTKNSRGQRYTGVGMVVCGRSEMVLPASVGNLQKGERYANMDYMFGSALRSVLVPLVLISYDIACQWFINLHKRISEHWPPEIQPRQGTQFTPAIPKLHEPMHHAKNHQVYSLNHIPGAGHCDCECCERVWASHNALGKSTKTQGPGSRHDVLDDNFAFWNWLKYLGIGVSLLRKYKQAVAERNVQVEAHRGLTASLGDAADKWRKMCEDWEADSFPKTKANPYYTEGGYLSEKEVKEELANAEAERVARGGIVLHETSASAFLVMGLELEENQRRVHRQAMKVNNDSTPYQKAALTEVRTQLRARIQAWEQLAPIYMPGLLYYRSSRPLDPSSSPNTQPISASEESHSETLTLWMPSRIDTADRSRVCATGLAVMEDKLRTAQCLDALQSLRQILRLKTRMIEFKNKNLQGQRDGTRSRAVIDRVHDRARACVAKYRAARQAKLQLVGEGEWEKGLRLLKDEDVRGYQDAERLKPRPARKGIWEDDEMDGGSAEGGEDISLYHERTRRDGTGETRRVLSWIWAAKSSLEEDSEDIMRAEWAQSRSRANRATEEVAKVKEEMRRVLETLSFESSTWEARGNGRTDVDEALKEGLEAYAHAQATLRVNLQGHFRARWKHPLEDDVGCNEDTGMDGTESDDDDDEFGQDD